MYNWLIRKLRESDLFAYTFAGVGVGLMILIALL